MSVYSLSDLLEGFNQSLLDKLNLGRKTAKHPVYRGDASESSWLELFDTYLPRRYQASKGFIVDSKGQVSDQIDIVLFDRQYSPFIFKMDAAEYIPAESVYAVFEVKQTLNGNDFRYAQQKAASVRQLMRTTLPVPTVQGIVDPPPPPPYIHAGFLCFDSGWTPPFGQPFEKAMGEGLGNSMVNLTCVANAGFFEADEFSQTMKMSDKAVTHFFFRLVSILQKKGTAPMIDLMAYAEWLDQPEQARKAVSDGA